MIKTLTKQTGRKGNPQGHWEPRKNVVSLSPAKHVVGCDPRTFQF